MCNCREDFENKDTKWCILTVFETIWNYREKFENNDDKWCIVTVSDFREHFENEHAK